jgi:hypothetical protein
MSKYELTAQANAYIVSRMYQDHGYTVDEICLRLRYPVETVETIIKKHNLTHGEKSWRY